jgi:hypothetical protein
MINADRLQKVLTYLAETDEPAARAKSLVTGLEESLKSIRADQFLQAKGTNGEREAFALSSQAYKDHIEKIKDATYDYEVMRNKRTTAVLIVEVWRSEQANRRSGNIT